MFPTPNTFSVTALILGNIKALVSRRKQSQEKIISKEMTLFLFGLERKFHYNAFTS
jgi:hypothetical protein